MDISKEHPKKDNYPDLMVSDDIIIFCDMENNWKDVLE